MEHNLAAGITEKVFRYIYRIFVNARKLFGEPTGISPDDIMNHYFNVSSLKRGLTMPQDRLCKRCGKIGHVRKSCPQKENNSKRGKGHMNDRAKKVSSDIDGTVCHACRKRGHTMSQCTLFMGDGYRRTEHEVFGGKKARETSKDRSMQDADVAGKCVNQAFNASSKEKENMPMKSKAPVGMLVPDNMTFLGSFSQLKVADNGDCKNTGALKKQTNHNTNARKNEMKEATSYEDAPKGGARKRSGRSFFDVNEQENSQRIHSRNNGK